MTVPPLPWHREHVRPLRELAVQWDREPGKRNRAAGLMAFAEQLERMAIRGEVWSLDATHVAALTRVVDELREGTPPHAGPHTEANQRATLAFAIAQLRDAVMQYVLQQEAAE